MRGPMTQATDARDERRTIFEGLANAVANGADVSTHLAAASARVQVDDCNACPLGASLPNRVPYEGGSSSIMFVGEAPGAREAEEGRPFVGRSGILLRSQIVEAGITEFAIGNTICCRPPVNNYDTAIEAGAPDACRVHLDRALSISGAWIVVEVGGKAANQFGWFGSVSSSVGKWRWRGGRLHTTIWHPAYLLRRGGAKSREARHNLDVLAEAYRATQGVGRYVPEVPYTTQVASTIGTSSTDDMVRTGLAKVGYVPIHSKVLGANVVIYDPDRISPMSSIKLPPGFGVPIFFTVKELAILKRPVDVRRVAALKEVINVEVVA